MVIQHNIAGMNANRQLNITTGIQAKSSEKLSSGYRINRAADDAAGLAISEKMRRQIRGLTQASSNAQDGISLVQVADGGMAEVHDMLQRGNELAVKAANGTLTDEDRNYIQLEIDQIKAEIDAINGKTTFNEIYVLRGTDTETTTSGVDIVGGLPDWVGIDSASSSAGNMASEYTTQVDYTLITGEGDEAVTTSGTADIKHAATMLDFSAYDPSKLEDMIDQGFYCTCCTCNNHYSVKFTDSDPSSNPETSGTHYIYSVNISDAQNGNDIVQKIISTIGNRPRNHYTLFEGNGSQLILYDGRSKEENPYPGAEYDSTQWPKSGISLQAFNTKPSATRGLFGQGVAEAHTETTKGTKNLILQVGADNEDSDHLLIELPYISAKTCSIEGVSVMTQTLAQSAINSFKAGIAYVSEQRSRMGAYQNRLEHTVRNLDNVVENTQAAETQIRDTDMATEMVKYSNNNILMQAGQAMLAQANQTNQGVMALLQ